MMPFDDNVIVLHPTVMEFPEEVAAASDRRYGIISVRTRTVQTGNRNPRGGQNEKPWEMADW